MNSKIFIVFLSFLGAAFSAFADDHESDELSDLILKLKPPIDVASCLKKLKLVKGPIAENGSKLLLGEEVELFSISKTYSAQKTYNSIKSISFSGKLKNVQDEKERSSFSVERIVFDDKKFYYVFARRGEKFKLVNKKELTNQKRTKDGEK